MEQRFRKPEFSKGNLELRYEDNVVCIYGTETGLRTLVDCCQRLIQDPNEGHVHLEDYQVLTPKSENGAIAIFPDT